jgi:hypothetical protein
MNSDALINKHERLARRLHQVRLDTYGEQGSRRLAEHLGIPTRTWIHFETGAPIPEPILHYFIELTGVETYWLRTGLGPRYRASPLRSPVQSLQPEEPP